MQWLTRCRDTLRALVGRKRAYAITRHKNVTKQRAVFRLCQRYPGATRRLIRHLNAKQLRPHVNPNLKYHFIRTQKTGDMVSIGSHGSTSFYVCGNAEGDCPRAAQQEAFDGRKAFSDFIMFVYEAATVPSSGGSGRQTGGSFVYSVR